MTSGLLRSRLRKEKLAVKKLRYPSIANLDNYRTYNTLYNKIKRTAMKLYYENKFKEFSKDIRATWETVKEALGTSNKKTKISNIFQIRNQKVDNINSITDGFNEFFSKVGEELASRIHSSNINFSEFLGERIVVDFIFAPLTPQTLMNIASQMKPKTSQGPDYLSSKLLKDIIPIIIDPLCHISNLSLHTGYIPDRFKLAKVIPVFKSGDKTTFSNYRPISLLSSLSKLLEKVVAKQMEGFLRVNSILYLHQYGFRKNHCTFHPILHFLNNIYEALNKEEPEYTLGIFLDLKKAFDTVDHGILLMKLDHYGFRGVSNQWFSNYLKGRKQYVSINGTNSDPRDIKHGVPQGSVLGPLYFSYL